MSPSPTIHASAVLVGYRGILIRGPSGAGKSQLALRLLQSPGFSQLIGDDRLHVEALHGRLLIRPADALRGLFEIRGVGIIRMAFEPVAVASLVVDLGVSEAERLPSEAGGTVAIAGVRLARLAVAPGHDPLAAVLAALCGDVDTDGAGGLLNAPLKTPV